MNTVRRGYQKKSSKSRPARKDAQTTTHVNLCQKAAIRNILARGTNFARLALSGFIKNIASRKIPTITPEIRPTFFALLADACRQTRRLLFFSGCSTQTTTAITKVLSLAFGALYCAPPLQQMICRPTFNPIEARQRGTARYTLTFISVSTSLPEIAVLTRRESQARRTYAVCVSCAF